MSVTRVTYPAGSFRLTIVVRTNTGTIEVPAHTGSISRDAARKLQKVYRTARPEAVTRVRKALQSA